MEGQTKSIMVFLKVAYCDRLGLKESYLSALLLKFISLQPWY